MTESHAPLLPRETPFPKPPDPNPRVCSASSTTPTALAVQLVIQYAYGQEPDGTGHVFCTIRLFDISQLSEV